MTFITKPRNGFLLGKFMPLQEGHKNFIRFAQNYCQYLTILVCSLPNEPIDGYQRFLWMQEAFPNCNVVWCNEVVPQTPEEHELFWPIWKDLINRHCPNIRPDVVFASEHYGHRLAAELGARFVPVDIDRTCIPISATKIRNNPFEYWDYIPQEVRPFYTKRVTVFGVESTGKSTVAKLLGEHYRTPVIPEYGRVYTEAFGSDVNADDLKNIVAGHMASVAAAKYRANKIIIEDTDPVMTAVWSDMLIGHRDPWFDEFNDYADLYLLMDIDIPWVNDGTRYFSNDDDRKRFHEKCENELIKRGVNYKLISGPYRFKSAVSAIRNEFFPRVK